MKRKTVATQNVADVLTMMERLEHGSQFLSVIFGPAGLGKTSAVAAISERYSGAVVYVRACEAWRHTRPMMVADILTALNSGWGAEWHSLAFLYRELLAELTRRKETILVIDEADYLSRGKRHDLLNMLRDLSDQTGVRNVFISINSLARLLSTPTEFLEAVTSRICAIVEFKRASLSDATKIAKELIEGVTLSSETIAECYRVSSGSLRILHGLYSQLEARARDAMLTVVNLAEAISLGVIEAPVQSAKGEPTEKARKAVA